MVSPTTELAPSSRRLELTLGALIVVLLGVIVWGVATGWHPGGTQKPAPVTQPSLGAPIVSGPSLVPLGRDAFTVASGRAATGSACFTVSANGARRLKLALSRGAQQASGPRTWFALR